MSDFGVLPRKAPDLVARDIAGECLLVPVRGNLADLRRIFALTPVAEHVWRQLDRVRSYEELLSSVVERFDVADGQADADLREFLEELRKAALVIG